MWNFWQKASWVMATVGWSIYLMVLILEKLVKLVGMCI